MPLADRWTRAHAMFKHDKQCSNEIRQRINLCDPSFRKTGGAVESIAMDWCVA
jgi:hypothetical protein